MGKVQTYRNTLSAFISSENGQRFFNFAYSIGAAIVIWGALFKILHLPGGNMLLSIGMGTEVLMFILTAFDRPPKEYKWEEVFPVLNSHDEEDRPNLEGGSGSGVIIAGGQATGAIAAGNGAALAPQVYKAPRITEDTDINGAVTEATQQYLDQMSQISAEMQHLRETTAALNNVSEVLLQSYKAITENSENITNSSKGYVDQIQDLNRNISGLNTIYEIQLKSVSSQLDAIDRVNRGIKDIRDMYEKSAGQSARYCEETEKMTRNLQQINAVYEKMITAMTVNIYRPMGGAPVAMPDVAEEQSDKQ